MHTYVVHTGCICGTHWMYIYVVHTGCICGTHWMYVYVVLTGCICGTHWMHMWYSLEAYVVLASWCLVPHVVVVFVMYTVRVCQLTRHVPIHQVNMHTHMYLFCVYVCVGVISYYAKTYLDITYKCSVD